MIPQDIALVALGIAASVVMIIVWFGALALGRLPAWCDVNTDNTPDQNQMVATLGGYYPAPPDDDNDLD